MTKLQEIMNLTMLEADIIQFGKIENDENDEDEFCLSTTLHDTERLSKFKFFKLQNKYNYGWYISDYSLEDQIKEIEKFKLYIMDNYKED